MGSAALIFAYLVMIIIGLILPSDGNHSAFAPKSLAFFMAAFFFIFYLVAHRNYYRDQIKASIFVFFAISFLLIWTILGVDQDPLRPSGQYDQFKVFLITLFVPFVSYYLVKQKIITIEKILKTAIYANLAYCTIKVSLMMLHVAHVINIWKFMNMTGLRYMSMEISGSLGRIQTSVDIVTPYFIFFVLMSDKLGFALSTRFKWFYFVISLISNFLSFSRLLLFVYLLSLFFYWLTLRISSIIKMLCVAGICMVAGIIVATPQKVAEVVERRLFSKDNFYSDLARKEQIEAMMNACETTPFFGKGVGGYTPDCIRDGLLPHAYEVQWVAFLMQFGAVGIILILVPIAIISWKLIEPPITRDKIGFFLLFGLWLSSGFTNPFLISLTSGIMYMIFLLAGEKLNSRQKKLAA